ncbi:hypothetical protein GGR56DRAFT_654796, partial [Xylariaceae sp. FL0804]
MNSAASGPLGKGLHHDPRSSSTQSLVPSLPDHDTPERRRLLIVYIHGFMGNDSSFQSFPAHVHRYLRLALSETHVIHSKIYPKYKTYKAIGVARDRFSQWLEPHETPDTDVILVGHSMGGLLAADVALIRAGDGDRQQYFRHRIIGTVQLDAPLLGLHPGIIVAGISSLFRKNEAPKGPGQASTPDLHQGVSGSTSPEPPPYPGTSVDSEQVMPVPHIATADTLDPNFNPSFPNDVRLQDRGWWKNVFHFVKKHSSENLIDATTQHIMSHLEFGSCLLDLNGLKVRYENIRKLEDIDDFNSDNSPQQPPRVRFIQYYTICHGYPKKPKPQSPLDSPSGTGSYPVTPGISAPGDNGSSRELGYLDGPSQVDTDPLDETSSERSSLEMLEPLPLSEEAPEGQPADPGDRQSMQDTKKDVNPPDSTSPLSDVPHPPGPSSGTRAAEPAQLDSAMQALYLDLPALPELPQKPEPPDLDRYADKDARKLAEKEGKRAQKAYEQAVKGREKAVKERQKIVDKRRKKQQQEAEARGKQALKERQKEQQGDAAAPAAATAAAEDALSPQESSTASIGPGTGTGQGGAAPPPAPAPGLGQQVSQISQDIEAGSPVPSDPAPAYTLLAAPPPPLP